MDNVQQHISYLLDGYECGQRSDVYYAIKCRKEMQELSDKYPEDSRVTQALSKMGK